MSVNRPIELSVTPRPGRYVRQHLLGAGGTAEVYAARASGGPKSGLRVACKVIRSELKDDTDAVSKLLGEAALLRDLQHPSLPRLHGVGRDGDGRTYIAMSYGGDTTLESMVDDGGALHPASACALVLQLAEAVAHLHGRGIRHGDIKPANIIIGPTWSPTLVDLGMARRLGDHDAGMIYGTPHYLAPEVILGRVPTCAADVYALGAVLYTAVTGATLFAGDSSVEICQHQISRVPVTPSRRSPYCLPRLLDQVILGALAKTPSQRLTLGEMRAALEWLLDRLPAPAQSRDDRILAA